MEESSFCRVLDHWFILNLTFTNDLSTMGIFFHSHVHCLPGLQHDFFDTCYAVLLSMLRGIPQVQAREVQVPNEYPQEVGSPRGQQPLALFLPSQVFDTKMIGTLRRNCTLGSP